MSHQLPTNCPVGPGATAWFLARDSGGDAQERSVPQQIEAYRAYCKRFSLVDDGIFVDVAKPGSSAETREGLQTMLAEARRRWPPIHDRSKRERKAETINHVIVFWNASRVGRDQIESGHIKFDLRMRGLHLASIADPLTGDRGVDMLLEAFLAWKAEMDLSALSTDAKRGIHAIISLRDTDPEFRRWNPDWPETGRYLGIYPNRVIPKGFKVERIRVGTHRTGKPRIVQRILPDPDMAELVRLAWRRRVVDRADYRTLQDETGLYRTHSSFNVFFGNRLYIGELKWGDEVYGSADDPFVEPLVPREWFEIEAERRRLAEERRQKDGRAPEEMLDNRQRRRSRLLSGLLYCARCGEKLWAESIPAGIISTTGRRRKRWPFYWCSGARQHRCDAGRINARRLEEGILQLLNEHVLNPEAMREHLQTLGDALNQRHNTFADRIAAAAGQLAQQEQRLANLAAAIAERGHSRTLLKALDETEVAVDRLKRELDALQGEAARWENIEITHEEAEEIVEALRAKIAEGTEPARYVLATLIARIEVDSGKPTQIRIYYNIAGAEICSTAKQGFNEPSLGGTTFKHCTLSRPGLATFLDTRNPFILIGIR